MSTGEDLFLDVLRPSREYRLSQVRLNFQNPTLAIFKAILNGPNGKPVWARAWLSTEAGTLAEAASPELKAGDEVTLEVIVPTEVPPQYAYMRIESAPLKTEHVVAQKLR